MKSPAAVQSKQRYHSKWLTALVCLLTTLGLLFFLVFTLVHWTERQILTSDNWVEVVAPLPKDDTVATALSNYSVNQFVTAVNLQDKIAEVLPDRAAFLAPVLTEQLQSRLTRRTKSIIQSNQFESLWRTANKAASERLIQSARGQTNEQPKTFTRFNLDISSIKESIQSLLGPRAPSLAEGDSAPVSIGVTVKTRIERIKTYIRVVDFLNAVSWLAALVCLLGAVVLAANRRRMVLIITIAIVVIALLQLIGLRAVRPVVLNYVETGTYRPAIGIVYDTLVESFKNSALNTFIAGLIVFAIAFLLKASIIRRSSYLATGLDKLEKSVVWKRGYEVRLWVTRYRWHLAGVATLAGLILMAFVVTLDWQGIINSILIIILSIEVINLVAARPRKAPMKQ